MNLIRRFLLVFHIHHSRSVTDAVTALEQAAERIDERLAEARGLLSCCEDDERRLLDLLNSEQQLENRMRSRAAVALRAGRGALAFEAMKRCLLSRQRAIQYHHLWEAQRQETIRMRHLQASLEERRLAFERSRQQVNLGRQIDRARRYVGDILYGDTRRQSDQESVDLYLEELLATANCSLTLTVPVMPTMTGEPPVDERRIHVALRDLCREESIPVMENYSGDEETAAP